MSNTLGRETSRVVRLDAFATNAVYAVDVDGARFIVKASPMHDSLRAEAWACARAADAGCAAPAILGFGRLADAGLRGLHRIRPPGFGWLAEAVWDESSDARSRTARGGASCTASVATFAAWRRVAWRRLRWLQPPKPRWTLVPPPSPPSRLGALCHGDLKAAHILVDAPRLAGVIDWGDAVVADPLWDIARFAHRADVEATASLIEAYDPERATADDLAWRIPLYGALWMLVDAIVDHRLGRRVDALLETALACFAQQAR